jgi:RNA polymerase primary sigma factor
MAKAAAKKTVKKTTPKTKTIARKPVKAVAAKAVAPKKPVAKKPAAKPVAPTRAPAVSKDELRAQIEKLNNTIAGLRVKNREAVKALKAAEHKIAALEHEISQTAVKPVVEAPVAPRKPRAMKPKPAPVEAESAEELPAPQDDAGDEAASDAE